MAGWAQEYRIRDGGDIHNARLALIDLDGWRLVEGMTVAGDVGLNPRDDLHVGCQAMVNDLLASRLKRGLVVLVAQLDEHVAGGMQPAGYGFGVAFQD